MTQHNKKPLYSYPMRGFGIITIFLLSRGEGLSLSGSIGRTIFVSLCIQIFYFIVARPYMDQISSEDILRNLTFGFVQWIATGWICWILATGFRLDKPVNDGQ